jgi:L-threonylcarbamoyladenylate synthase
LIEIVKNTVDFLKEGKTILYPTDTVWGIGCDATSFDAVKKIYKLKKREESKSLIILVDSVKMLMEYISNIPEEVILLLKSVKKPTTIIYNNPKNLASNVIAKDNTIAIRIVNDSFCKSLIHSFGKPIVSTSANVSGKSTPASFKDVSKVIKLGVDCVIEAEETNKNTKPSTILRIMEDGSIISLRE